MNSILNRIRYSPHRYVFVLILWLYGFQYLVSPLYIHPGHDGLLRQTAISVTEGDGYTACQTSYFFDCQPDDPTAAREPLPVLFIAAYQTLTKSLTIDWFLVQITLNAATGILIYILALQIFDDRRIGYIALAFWATYPPIVRTVPYFRLDPLQSFLIVLTVVLLVDTVQKPDWWRFALVGFVFGLSVLTRSVVLYALVLILPAFYFVCERNLRRAASRWAILIVVTGVTIAPWIVRNALVFNNFVPGSTLNGYNLLRHNHIIESDDYLRYVRSGEAGTAIRAMLKARGDVIGDENEAEMDDIYLEESLRIIRQHPLKYLSLTAYRFFFFQYFEVQFLGSGRYQGNDLHLYLIISNLILLPTAVIGALRLPREKWRLAWPAAMIFVYFALIHPLVVTLFRYQVPVMPMAFLFAGYALVRLTFADDRAPRYRWQRLLLVPIVGIHGLWALGHVLAAPSLQVRQAHPVRVDYLNGDFSVVGYKPSTDILEPGETLEITYFMQANRQITKALGLSTHLLTPDYESVVQIDAITGEALTTELWPAGKLMAQTVRLDLPDDLETPSAYSLQLSLWQFDDAEYPPEPVVSTDTGELISSDKLILTRFPAPGERPLQEPVVVVNHDYGLFQMTGYKLPAELSSGDPLDLIFWWQTGSQALTAPYAQFIHLFRTTDNTFVAGYDAQPFDGRFPTEVWPANLQIMDERTIQLPDDLPPGEYELFTGMYDTMTKERLPITVNGESLPNGIVSIGTFRIQ